MSHPRTNLPDSRISPRFAGIATFARYPRLEDVLPDNRPVDWAVYGVPYDSGVTYRPGARFGPRAIRDASQYLKRFSIAHGVDVCEAFSLADAGDAPVKPFHPGECIEDVAAWATGLAEPTTRLLALGGDHSIAYANIEATWRRCGSPSGGLALIHFDSHLDTVDSVWGERWSHASPFIRAIERGIINPRRMISIGIKGPLNTAGDLDFARENGVTIVTREEWADAGPGTLAGFVRHLDEEPAYITFDIDVVDPAFAPGTGTPSIGGFSSTEVLAILRSLAGVHVAGADVVEVLPDRDVAQNTALLAAHVAFEILCLSATQPR
ncbi:MAG: agmatinase [Phycisphaerales bacterium]|nr:agmatinase [Phycisphaerales bacterium]